MRILMQKTQLNKIMPALKNFLLILLMQLIMCNVPIVFAKEKSSENPRIKKTEILSPKQQMAEHTEVLRDLMLQLYSLYPNELAKSTQVSAREMTEWVFDGKANWRYDAIRNVQAKEALALFLEPSYQGDHVLPLVVGLETLLFSAYGAKNEFDIPNEMNTTQLSHALCFIQEMRLQLSQVETYQHNTFMVEFLENQNVNSIFDQILNKISERLMANVGVKK
jgi:hypothetical protein